MARIALVAGLALLLSFCSSEVFGQGDRTDRQRRGSDSRQDLRNRRGNRGNRGRAASNKGLKIGETAPAFKLKSLDGKSETELASFKNKKPVVLFFGSYT